jgi:hypothetical protein
MPELQVADIQAPIPDWAPGTGSFPLQQVYAFDTVDGRKARKKKWGLLKQAPTVDMR